MPILHVEEVPVELYERIQRRASAQNRDVPQEVIALLEQALTSAETDTNAVHRAALSELRRLRWTPPPGAPKSVDLLREDRER
jgi:hypothetical protein